jgi:hypothetical protein
MISCKNRLTRRLCQQGFNYDRVRAEGIRARGRAPPVPADLAAHPAFLLTMARAWFGRQPRAMGRRSGVGPSSCSCPWATGRLVRAISLVAPVRRVRSCPSVSPARDETGPMTLKSRRPSGPGVPRSRPRSVEAAIGDQRRTGPAPRARPRRHGCDGAAGAWCRGEGQTGAAAGSGAGDRRHRRTVAIPPATSPRLGYSPRVLTNPLTNGRSGRTIPSDRGVSRLDTPFRCPAIGARGRGGPERHGQPARQGRKGAGWPSGSLRKSRAS